MALDAARSHRRIKGANDRVRIGLIGCGLRGRGLGDCLLSIAGAEVRAVSDAHALRRERAAARLGPGARAAADYREVLDRKDIDAVVIATPDHWHVPMTVGALSAGKDVYVEKPVTHGVAEGDRLLRAAAASRQVVATGTQQRSWDHFLEARQVVDEGWLGRVTFARCHWHQGHLRPGDAPALDHAPGALDWRLWLGPARPQPFDAVRFRHWRYFWDFGGGSVCDLMTHWIDVVQWFMDSPRASEVTAFGANYVQDWFETPDTVSAAMAFPEGYMAAFEANLTCGLQGCGIVFRGTKAMMVLDRLGYAVFDEGAVPHESATLPEPSRIRRQPEAASDTERMDGTGTEANLRDWLDCIRSRNPPHAGLRAGIEAAHSAHLVNRALREKAIIRLD